MSNINLCLKGKLFGFFNTAACTMLLICGHAQNNINAYSAATTMTTANTAAGKLRNPYPAIYINLMTPVENKLELVDGVAAAFSNKFSAAVDGDDASKLWNFNENISLLRDGQNLAIELRPKPKDTDTLFFRLALRQQPYCIKIYSQNLKDNITGDAWIVDKYLNTKKQIDLFDTTIYDFTPVADTNSYRNRFMLVFERNKHEDLLTDKNYTETKGIISSLPGISIFPNPAKTSDNIMLRFDNIVKGYYKIIIFNSRGQQLSGNKIYHNGGNIVYALSLNLFRMPGIYSVHVEQEGVQKHINLQLIINN